METKQVTRSSLHLVAGVFLSIVVWTVIYCIAYVGLTLLDFARGNIGWLENVFREVFTAGIGGYVALYAVKRWLPKAHLKHVLWGFSVPVFLFLIGLPIFIIVFMSHEVRFSWGEQIIRWFSGCTTILGAYLACKVYAQK